MNTSSRAAWRTIMVAARAMVLMTATLGLVYTLIITGVGQLAVPAKANGSLLTDGKGNTVGSALIGQLFADDLGSPLPQYFQPRPSAAGDGYDAGASSGSNLGPENPVLVHAIQERKVQVAAFNKVEAGTIPADALTASSSGLDPHISVDYALLQIDRVALARGVSADQVRTIVNEHTDTRDLGFLGEPRVNVLELNLALDDLEK